MSPNLDDFVCFAYDGALDINSYEKMSGFQVLKKELSEQDIMNAVEEAQLELRLPGSWDINLSKTLRRLKANKGELIILDSVHTRGSNLKKRC